MSQPEQTASVSAGAQDGPATPVGPDSDQLAYDPAAFTLADMVRCGQALRLLAAESASMEEAGQRVTGYLYQRLRESASNNRACVLVRSFKTHAYAGLSQDLRDFAVSMAAGTAIDKDTKCLTLLATSGDEPQWNSRRTSKGHRAIPLISEAMVGQFPMIAQLIRQLGLATSDFIRTRDQIIKELDQRKFGVFHVPVATNSPFIPAQNDFVAPYGVASVLGFGGMLPDGDLFVVIIFARVPIPASTAEMFRTIALNLKLGLLASLDKPVFAD
ncbi:MAG TPA: hypothetical protein VGY99_04665 [Candidatus Binataceae bacterium]|jgi:hypothetical protein|nr:hypothetical protein [Candidatus Binataceae bacterium]